jgi:hypothetical protein
MQETEFEDQEITELAQKLYEEDGHGGDVYKSKLDKIYDDRAIEILRKRDHVL